MAEASKTAAGVGPKGASLPSLGTSLAGGLAARKPRSLWSDAWLQFRKHKLALVGTFVLAVIILSVAFGPFIYTVNPQAIDIVSALQGPSRVHPMGLDSLGHDILSRILTGGRKSILVGLMAMFVSLTVGTLVGAMAGFFGRSVDSLLMRLTDLFIALPQLPLLLLMSYLYGDRIKKISFVELLLMPVAFMINLPLSLLRLITFDNIQLEVSFPVIGPPLENNGTLILIVLIIGALNWMPVARLVRASFLSLKEKEFVEAARCLGADNSSLIFKHILPNVLSPVIVAATLGVGSAIILESTLSFLGLGFPPDVPTWGSMLQDAKDLLEFAPHLAIFPGMMIFLVVLSVNYIGDGLRDALDPRSRS